MRMGLLFFYENYFDENYLDNYYRPLRAASQIIERYHSQKQTIITDITGRAAPQIIRSPNTDKTADRGHNHHLVIIISTEPKMEKKNFAQKS